MTIQINVGLPIGTKDVSVQMTMPVEDAIAFVNDIGKMGEDMLTAGGPLATLRDALLSKLNL
jgi:hypothetical protein